MKGRPISPSEFGKFIEAVPKVVGESHAADWKQLLVGLWLSGLRLGEALKLGWTGRHDLSVDFSMARPCLRVAHEADKGRSDRLCPITPDFAEFLELTPKSDRKDYVFRVLSRRDRESRLELRHASRMISEMGRVSGVLVDERDQKFVSAHDLRRSFAARWAVRVPPLVLKTLMRHASIATTQEYYVGSNAEETAELLWRSHVGGTPQHDTLHDTWRNWLSPKAGESPQPPAE